VTPTLTGQKELTARELEPYLGDDKCDCRRGHDSPRASLDQTAQGNVNHQCGGDSRQSAVSRQRRREEVDCKPAERGREQRDGGRAAAVALPRYDARAADRKEIPSEMRGREVNEMARQQPPDLALFDERAVVDEPPRER